MADDRLIVDFSSDDEWEDCCNLMVSRVDSKDGITDILFTIDGRNARDLYETLVGKGEQHVFSNR